MNYVTYVCSNVIANPMHSFKRNALVVAYPSDRVFVETAKRYQFMVADSLLAQETPKPGIRNLHGHHDSWRFLILHLCVLLLLSSFLLFSAADLLQILPHTHQKC